MIESCSTERMLIGVIVLGGFTFFVLYIESYWTDISEKTLSPSKFNKSNTDCWLREVFKIVQECHPCSDFEINSKSNAACVATNYKELVKCEKSGKVFRSCSKVSWIEEKKFWRFECTIFVLSLVFSLIAYFRQKVLDHYVMLRIQKQLSSYP